MQDYALPGYRNSYQIHGKTGLRLATQARAILAKSTREVTDIRRRTLGRIPQMYYGDVFKSNLSKKCKELRSMTPLGKLKYLRVLDVSGTGIKEISQSMENLVKLKLLDMGQIDLDELLKEILPKCSHLQYLNLSLCINAPVETWPAWNCLKNLEVGLTICIASTSSLEATITMRKIGGMSYLWGKGCPILILMTLEMVYIETKGVIVEDCTIEAGGGEAPTSIILPHCVDIDLKNLEKLRVCWRDEMEDIIASEKGRKVKAVMALQHSQVVTFQS
ncbi:hypothetical protein HAX54_014607 [Datura stramonium]|uniref:Uncharacterized protein n=1 Tax=Datura stramonium TaxID=4076 RepID=A0ABS8RZ21_DATST|nr:hypothetical protein [Datura stramonium]